MTINIGLMDTFLEFSWGKSSGYSIDKTQAQTVVVLTSGLMLGVMNEDVDMDVVNALLSPLRVASQASLDSSCYEGDADDLSLCRSVYQRCYPHLRCLSEAVVDIEETSDCDFTPANLLRLYRDNMKHFNQHRTKYPILWERDEVFFRKHNF